MPSEANLDFTLEGKQDSFDRAESHVQFTVDVHPHQQNQLEEIRRKADLLGAYFEGDGTFSEEMVVSKAAILKMRGFSEVRSINVMEVTAPAEAARMHNVHETPYRGP